MAASGHAVCHADVSMTSSGGSGMMTSAWPMLTSSLTRSTLTQSTVNGQRSPVSGGSTGQSAGLTDRWDPRVSAVQKEKGKRDRVFGPKVLLGSSRSWACWAGSGPFLLLFLFLFLLFPLRLTPWSHLSASPGSRAASSRSGANSSACVRACARKACHAANTASRRGRGDDVATARRGGGPR